MNSSEVELKLPLGDFLFNEVRRMAASMDMREDQWVFYFLANGRLTPSGLSEMANVFAHTQTDFLRPKGVKRPMRGELKEGEEG